MKKRSFFWAGLLISSIAFLFSQGIITCVCQPVEIGVGKILVDPNLIHFPSYKKLCMVTKHNKLGIIVMSGTYKGAILLLTHYPNDSLGFYDLINSQIDMIGNKRPQYMHLNHMVNYTDLIRVKMLIADKVPGFSECSQHIYQVVNKSNIMAEGYRNKIDILENFARDFPLLEPEVKEMLDTKSKSVVKQIYTFLEMKEK